MRDRDGRTGVDIIAHGAPTLSSRCAKSSIVAMHVEAVCQAAATTQGDTDVRNQGCIGATAVVGWDRREASARSAALLRSRT